MLDLIKELLGIYWTDTTKDNILNHYISRANNTIKNYLNVEDVTPYNDAIVDLAAFYYRNSKDEGIVQQSQGSRSKSLKDGIPHSIKDTLSKPKIKVVG